MFSEHSLDNMADSINILMTQAARENARLGGYVDRGDMLLKEYVDRENARLSGYIDRGDMLLKEYVDRENADLRKYCGKETKKERDSKGSASTKKKDKEKGRKKEDKS